MDSNGTDPDESRRRLVLGLLSLPIAVAHGTYDPVIPVEHAHRSVEQLRAAGADVLYRESPMEHAIDPNFVAELRPWLEDATSS